MPADAGEDGALAVLVGAEQDHRLVQIAAKYAGIIIVEGNDHTQVVELGAFPDGAVQVEYGVFPAGGQVQRFKTAEAIAGIKLMTIPIEIDMTIILSFEPHVAITLRTFSLISVVYPIPVSPLTTVNTSTMTNADCKTEIATNGKA